MLFPYLQVLKWEQLNSNTSTDLQNGGGVGIEITIGTGSEKNQSKIARNMVVERL